MVRSDLLERAIESFRREALDLDTYDPLLDELPADATERSEVGPYAAPLASDDHGRMPEVRILGPIEISGWLTPPDRAIVTELACYLVLHRGRALSGESIRAALRPNGDGELSAKTLRTYLSALRTAIGSDAFPPGTGGGYQLSTSVSCDWERFRDLAGQGDLTDRLRALELVRGRPFEDAANGSFSWAFAEFMPSEIEVSVATVARDTARECSERGDLPTALWALRRGLESSPADFALWEAYLTLAARMDRGTLERAQREARAALGDDAPTGSPS